MTKPLCIYHGNCADGFTAAWAVWRALGDGAEYVPGIYGKEPPDVTGRDVLLVDFSYKLPVLEAMMQPRGARSLLILDHHKTAAEDLAGLPDARPKWDQHVAFAGAPACDPVGVVFDLERSGAGIAWDYFHPGVERHPLVNYVEDRDLWRFKLPFSREIAANIFSYEYTFANWDWIANELNAPMGVSNLGLEGRAIERKHHKDVAELVRVTKRRMVIGGHEVWCANLPYTLTSDAGNLMAKGEPFAACYWDTPDGRVFSLRSTPEGADVSEIAKAYGGGGHKNAAGFRVSFGHALCA